MAGCVAGPKPTPAELETMQTTPCSAAHLPTGAAFYTSLDAAIATGFFSTEWDGDVPGYFANVPGVGSKMLWATIRYEMTMLKYQSPTVVRPVYNEFKAFTDRYLADSPPATLGYFFPWAEVAFSWMVTQEQLVHGMVLGMWICFPMAFLVLLIITGSPRIATMATLTIALIVGSLLGIAESLLGYVLGTGESIAGTIVIGLSIDYAVHLSVTYIESSRSSREGKVLDAVTVMGPTVVASGNTTLGCAWLMYACQRTPRAVRTRASTVGERLPLDQCACHRVAKPYSVHAIAWLSLTVCMPSRG